MPCPPTGSKMFCVSRNFLSQSKHLIASLKTFVPAKKPNLLNENHLLVWHKIFGIATKCVTIFGLAKKFGPAPNIWTSPNCFETCRRTRHLSVTKLNDILSQEIHQLLVVIVYIFFE
jgi:hypothetical protein